MFLSVAQHKGRNAQIDYLKGIMILLMVSFHLVPIEQAYPTLKGIVYTFHMPVFFLLSGYLCKAGKPLRAFSLRICRLFVPYLFFETAYVICACFLPIWGSLKDVTVAVVLETMFRFPIGPYWFVYTLVVLEVGYYVGYCVVRRLQETLAVSTGGGGGITACSYL